jgi:hypothetical protein
LKIKPQPFSPSGHIDLGHNRTGPASPKKSQPLRRLFAAKTAPTANIVLQEREELNNGILKNC